MKAGDLIKHLLFTLLILEGSTAMATEQDNTPPTTPPIPPAVPTTPDHQGQANTQNTQHHFTDNDQNISMQIVGETPKITDESHARLGFAAGSYVRLTIRKTNGSDPIVIRWDNSGCIATQAGKNKPCGQAEREQIINLVQQLPTPPIPPSS